MRLNIIRSVISLLMLILSSSLSAVQITEEYNALDTTSYENFDDSLSYPIDSDAASIDFDINATALRPDLMSESDNLDAITQLWNLASQDALDNALLSIAQHQTVSISIGEILLKDKIEDHWKAIQQELKGIGKNLNISINAQLENLTAFIGADLFNPIGALGGIDLSRPTDNQNEAFSPYGGKYYAGTDAAPPLFEWFFKLVHFKNQHPLLFYGLIILAVVIVFVRSKINNAGLNHRSYKRRVRRRRRHFA